MKKWEYRLDRFDPTNPDVAARLDKHGREGWELVTSFGDGHDVGLIFKREGEAPAIPADEL